MAHRITIPATIEEVVAPLNGIEQLLVTKGWERAAIVAAYVEPMEQRGQPSKTKKGHSLMSTYEFATLGIAGLTKPDTVRRYAKAWLDAHDGIHPEPGAKVLLPEDPWPPMRTGTDGYNSDQGAQQTLDRLVEKHGASAVAEHLVESGPEVAEAARNALSRQPGRNLPKPPGGGGVMPTGNDTVDKPDASAWMDVDAAVGRLHSLVLDFVRFAQHTPDALVDRVPRVEREMDFLRMVLDTVTGVSDADLDVLLESSES